jgi:integrase/recombinase XerD
MINQTTQPKFSFYLDTRQAKKKAKKTGEPITDKTLHPLYLRATFQISKNNKKDWDRKLILLNHYCTEKEFKKSNNDTSAVKLDAMNKAAIILKTNTVITADDFVKKFNNHAGGDIQHVATIYDIIMKDCESNDDIGSADSYKSSLNSLIWFTHPLMYEKMRYRIKDGIIVKGEIEYPLSFMEITPEFIRRYVATWENKTSPAIYLRQLRAVINYAIDDDIISEDLYPFSRSKSRRNSKRKYAIKKTKGRGATMVLDEVDKNRVLAITDPKMKWAVDMWRFSYLCSGLNMIDIALLKYKNVGKDAIISSRHKTKNTDPDNMVVIPVNDEIKQIIAAHRGSPDGTKPLLPNPDDYIFPVLIPGLKARQIKHRVADFIGDVNDGLLLVEKHLGLTIHLTSYVARHTFANIILNKGGTKEYLKDALVHASQDTTEEYCQPFDLELKRKMQSLL